jgi:hypothetical protein
VSRGRHAARRAAREQRELDLLTEQVRLARQRLEEAQQQELIAGELEEQLQQEQAVLLERSRVRETELLETAAVLTVAVGDLEQGVDELDEAWRKLSRKASGRLGSWHALSSLLTGAPTLTTSNLDGVRPEAPVAVLRAHAGAHLPPGYTGTVSPLAWFADWLPEPAHIIGTQMRQFDPLTVRGVHRSVDLPEPLATSVTRVGPLVDAVAASTVDTLEPRCSAAWQPLPWLACGVYTPGDGDLQTRQRSITQTALGALEVLELDQWPAWQEPIEVIRVRAREWTAQQRRVRGLHRLATPWAPRPVFFRPADAEALRCWYRQDALSAWASTSIFAATLRDLHAQNPGLGEPEDLRGQIALAQHLTQQLDQAALYWLPPGHAGAHAAGEPLDSDALPDLRLPYPSVLLTFADPLALPPVDATATDTYQRKVTRARSALPDHTQPPTWRDWTADNVYTPADADREATYPHLSELLEHEGAFVEAVLLLADPDGRPLDLFAWCLAIPDHETGQILARTVVGARRSLTSYAQILNNLIAVVGWAEWHQPGGATSRDTATSGAGGPADHNGPDDVHVLRSGRGATWIRSTAREVAGTGNQIRPHRRRAHWRRQHHGPGNRLLKWIRVAPTIVNSHAGPLNVQIYRLPTAEGAKSGPEGTDG